MVSSSFDEDGGDKNINWVFIVVEIIRTRNIIKGRTSNSMRSLRTKSSPRILENTALRRLPALRHLEAEEW